MPKVSQSISLDFDDWELIAEIRSRYKAKNHSQAIHIIIKQYIAFVERQAIDKKTATEQPPIPQRSKGIPPLPDKYKMKKK